MDLDKLEALYKAAHASPDWDDQASVDRMVLAQHEYRALVEEPGSILLALVNELRTAREVVKQARRIRAIFPKDGVLGRALDVYDQAANP